MEAATARLMRGKSSWIWVVEHCPFCGKRHTHGGGALTDDPRKNLGARLAHCVTQSAANGRSYGLVEVSP